MRLPGRDDTELNSLRLQDPEGYRVSGNDQNLGPSSILERPARLRPMSPAERLAYHRERLGLGR